MCFGTIFLKHMLALQIVHYEVLRLHHTVRSSDLYACPVLGWLLACASLNSYSDSVHLKYDTTLR